MVSDERPPRPVPFEFHAYLAHAWEDKPFVEALAAELQKLGWRVWLDTLEMTVGKSLRVQMEEGLARSRFGIVVLSSRFFQKRWPLEELDALYALESGGPTRILPVWLDIDSEFVLKQSPMLAARVAAMAAKASPGAAAKVLDRSMTRLLPEGGLWGDEVRYNLSTGLLWLSPPQIFPESLRQLDLEFPQFWRGRDADVGPLVSDAATVRLPNFFDAAATFDGKPLLLVGNQVAQQHLATREMAGAYLHQYVVQIVSAAASHRSHLLYCLLAELTRTNDVRVPTCPPDMLTAVAGFVVARGAMRVSTNELYSGYYFVTARIIHLPRL